MVEPHPSPGGPSGPLGHAQPVVMDVTSAAGEAAASHPAPSAPPAEHMALGKQPMGSAALPVGPGDLAWSYRDHRPVTGAPAEEDSPPSTRRTPVEVAPRTPAAADPGGSSDSKQPPTIAESKLSTSLLAASLDTSDRSGCAPTARRRKGAVRQKRCVRWADLEATTGVRTISGSSSKRSRSHDNMNEGSSSTAGTLADDHAAHRVSFAELVCGRARARSPRRAARPPRSRSLPPPSPFGY